MLEVFLVSIVYWISLLLLFVWLNRRVQQLSAHVATLEENGTDREERIR